MSIRIGLDIRKFADFGIGSYIRHLVGGLSSAPEDLVFILMANKDTLSGERFPSEKNLEVKLSKRNRRLPNQGFLDFENSLDMYHAPHYISPSPRRVPLVLTIHDLIHRFPPFLPANVKPLEPYMYKFYTTAKKLYHQYFSSRNLIRMSHNAAQIIAVSKSTADSILKDMDIPAHRIRVIYNCIDDVFFQTQDENRIRETLEKYHLETKSYFLYCGNDLYHKNLGLVLDAWALLSQSGIPPIMVFAGPPHHKWIYQRARRYGISDYIKIYGRLSIKDLKMLYIGAKGFIFPSLAEGFGLPVIEALSCGTPVICSDLPVLREISHNACLFFDPSSPESLTFQINKIIVNSDIEDEFKERGKQLALNYQPDIFRNAHYDLYRDITRKG
ncbi:glycosyltransferase family 4 protein [bacterium]|nr:glycosyltransferase family 4 protein [candidate division CSSED10-310 bacterium]